MKNAAIAFVKIVLAISSADSQDWGRAMLAEMHHLNGAWESWRWAVGCSAILLRRTMISKLSQIWHASERANAVALVCLGLAGLLLLVPTFRQGMNVALSCWQIVSNSRQPNYRIFGNTWIQDELNSVIHDAETEHDAKTLAFAAERYPDASTAARLADEAVALDPSLTWIYTVVANNQWRSGNVPRWIDQLRRWAPDNALPDLMAAEVVDIRHAISGKDWQFSDSDWRQAMAGAFHSSKFDDYAAQQLALDREVASKRGLSDPLLFAQGYADGLYEGRLPSNASADVRLYARMLATQGKYEEIDRFGQLLRAPGQTDETMVIGAGLGDAMVGKNPETPFLTPAQQIRIRERLSRMHSEGSANRPRVRAIQISGLLFLTFTLALIFSLGRVFVRPSALAVRLAAVLSASLLASAASLYLSYRPYAVLFNHFLQSGDWSPIREFLIFSSLRPPFGPRVGTDDIRMYAWTAVITICSGALLWIVGSNALRRMNAARQ
jgi:hypothetical protein